MIMTRTIWHIFPQTMCGFMIQNLKYGKKMLLKSKNVEEFFQN